MHKLYILIGGVIIVVGILLICPRKEHSSGPTSVAARQAVSTFEPDAGYFTGSTSIDGRAVSLKYRRLRQPIVIGKDFRWPESFRESPMVSALSLISRMMRSVDANTLCQGYANPEYMKQFIQTVMNDKKWSLEQYQEYLHEFYVGNTVVGEVVHNDVTVVVIRWTDDHGNPKYAGDNFVKKGDQFLYAPELTLSDKVLQKLSADQYSLVWKEPASQKIMAERAQAQASPENPTFHRDPADPSRMPAVPGK